jgi:SpoIID/LytB domain protein
VPVPAELQDASLMPLRAAAVMVVAVVVCLGVSGFAPQGALARAAHRGDASQPAPGVSAPALPAGAAFFIRNLSNPRERRETRADILDTPVLPGSVVKAVTLVTALESGVLRPDSETMCRRVVTVDGVRFVCAHPDLRRPLSAAEALAHSCNDFFTSLARRLTRDQVNRTRLAAGLPPISASAKLGPSLVGLDGPRVSPRALIDVMARLTGVGPDPRVPMREPTRQVLLAGLSGAATYGTASALGDRGVSAWAKTGTAPMPGGGVAGLVVAFAPAVRPTHGVVVVAPGGAGVDAADIAADIIKGAATTAIAAGAGGVAAAAHVASPSVGPLAGTSAAAATGAAAPLSSGVVRLGRTMPDGRTRIETLPMDDYISQVLAGEGQPRAGEAAQQALAITARTFALANMNRHRREGFDLCDTTHCQVVRAATATTRRAAAATSGRALLARGRAASVFYSAWCGGRTERASQVWPGAADYGHPDKDEACAGEAPWANEMRVADVERALRASGMRGGRLRGLRVVQRNASGRVVRLRAEGFTPPEISGTDFRMAVGRIGGWQLVKSTAFDVERTGTGFRFRGRGFGHGVGLCVVGAGVRASQGATADAILRFYFPDLSIGPATAAAASVAPAAGVPVAASAGALPPSTTASATSARPTAPPGPSPSTARVTDVLLALPVAEEAERTTLLSLVRRVRDLTATATGRPAPSTLRVTVHPTIESFGRATGQPWWVSAATTGTDIDLLPIRLLKQRGQLERTLQHEVVHAMLDPALASKPMWVREGAAIYFSRDASQSRDARTPSRTGCPTDADLLRPVSAGAQRDAYARAEACFARAIASGKRWDEIR